ncbi:hypothetical protein V5O48_014129 [Marasmius crinis-equi]|uniref:Uncharacterized protein n=1 Tax=Marasmius crinis-equi TaxID=585013 RepID=A0ABR3EY97_9AGAR
MSIEEHKIMWREFDLTKAQNQYVSLTDAHTKLVDTMAMQTTKMEREVMELKAENKALVQAGSVARKDWKKRVGILETALSEKKEAYSHLSSIRNRSLLVTELNFKQD